jgi:GNAT superfamily N-acetyltransferase
MPEVTVYTSGEAIPAHFECQIRAFIRMLWHDEYLYNLDAPIFSPEKHPQHVVLAERHALISHARVVWVNIEHGGQVFKLYCLGDVFTYPAFRKRGYGRQVVDRATELIKADHEADAALLFTDPVQESFYGASGWEQVPGLTSMVGLPENREDHNYFAMMLFLSDKSRTFRQTFETQTLMLPGYGW